MRNFRTLLTSCIRNSYIKTVQKNQHALFNSVDGGCLLNTRLYSTKEKRKVVTIKKPSNIRKTPKVYTKVVGLNVSKDDRYGSKPKKKEVKVDLLDEGQDAVLNKIDFSNIELVPINKTSYVPNLSATSRSLQDVNNYRTNNEVVYRGAEIAHPIIKFEDYEFPDFIKCQFKEHYKFESPLPIQSYGWPLALSGRDFIGISQTGSGKSLAFLIPLLIHVSQQEPLIPGEGPIAAVIAPTVELSDQLYNVTRTFTDDTNIRCVTLNSGDSREAQIRMLRKGVEICFATPGRLASLLYSQETNLHRCSFIVIDEADKLLDCGLDSQITEIFSQCRPDRQTLMFSATWPLSFEWLVKKVLVEEAELFIGSSELSTNSKITQHFHFCEWECIKEKIVEVLDIILNDYDQQSLKILMFANTSKQTEAYQKLINLQDKGFVVDVIHGDKKLLDREVALSRFHKGNVNFMIATDVAARGLDVTNITHVISVGFPFTCEHYIHRIGRTGRAGKSGVSHTIVFKMDKNECSRLLSHLEDHNQYVNPELFKFLNAPKEYSKKRFKWK